MRVQPRSPHHPRPRGHLHGHRRHRLGDRRPELRRGRRLDLDGRQGHRHPHRPRRRSSWPIATSYLGWWRPSISETMRAPKWLWAVPVLMALPGLGTLLGGHPRPTAASATWWSWPSAPLLRRVQRGDADAVVSAWSACAAASTEPIAWALELPALRPASTPSTPSSGRASARRSSRSSSPSWPARSSTSPAGCRAR